MTKILALSVESFNGHPEIVLTVDKFPSFNDDVYRHLELTDQVFLTTVNDDGFANYCVAHTQDDGSPMKGFGGRAASYKLEDGRVVTYDNRWASRASVMNTVFSLDLIDCVLMHSKMGARQSGAISHKQIAGLLQSAGYIVKVDKRELDTIYRPVKVSESTCESVH